MHSAHAPGTMRVVCAALIAMTLPVTQMRAQATGESGAPEADTITDEIIVTARRRDESLSRVPTAITACSAEHLIDRSIRTDSDLQLAAPGLTIRQTQGNNSLTYSIRGQSPAPRTRLPGYELFNARLSWAELLGTSFSAALFGKNLLDDPYFVGGRTLASSLGHNAAAVGEPRTYGVELWYRF